LSNVRASFDAEQLSALEQRCSEWVALEQASAAIDMEVCKKTINELYAFYGRPAPVILWCESPWQMQLMLILSQLLPLEAQLWHLRFAIAESIAPGIWESLWKQTLRQFTPRRFAALRERSMKFPSFAKAESTIGNDRLAGFLRGSLDASVKSNLFGFRCWSSLFTRNNVGEHNVGAEIRKFITEHWRTPARDDFNGRFDWFRNRNGPLINHVSGQVNRTSFRELISTLNELMPSQSTRTSAMLEMGYTLGEVGTCSRMFGLEKRTPPLANRYMGITAQHIWWASWETDWLPLYQVICKEFQMFALPKRWLDELTLVCQLGEQAGAYLFFENLCLVSARPTCIGRDDQGRLHGEAGPALAYSDGFEIYSWHGTGVDEYVITQPGSLTPNAIEKEANAEIRRVMIERYGVERFIIDSGAELIESDEVGTLYAKYLLGDEPLVLVRLLDKTLLPDGTAKEYWLRVPPFIKSARAAVAWTFEMKECEYMPERET
jgi:hypothetical protein